MKKRTKLEIVKDILEVLKENRNVRITHIIYKANLSNNSIKSYISGLIENQLIKESNEKGKRYFVITEKGYEFLKEFGRMKIFSESYGLGNLY